MPWALGGGFVSYLVGRPDRWCCIAGNLSFVIPQEEALAATPGARVEYVVIELRGAIAHYEPVEDPVRMFKTVAAGLAEELKVGVTELVGCRFSCWVEAAEYGVFESDFRLVARGKDR
jgi:hypothetical protein